MVSTQTLTTVSGEEKKKKKKPQASLHSPPKLQEAGSCSKAFNASSNSDNIENTSSILPCKTNQ